MSKSLFILISIIWVSSILSSCTSKTQQYETIQVEQASLQKNTQVIKDSTSNNSMPVSVENKETTSNIKKDTWSNSTWEKTELESSTSWDQPNIWQAQVKPTDSSKNSEVTSISLQNSDSIKKYQEEQYDYEKLKDGLTSDLVNQTVSKIINELKSSSFPNWTQVREYDKLFFEKISNWIYQDLKNIRVIYVDKTSLETAQTTSEVSEEEGYDKDMNLIKVKSLKYFYLVDYNWSTYKVNKDKVDQYLSNIYVKWFYISRTDSNIVYPTTNLGLSWYYVLTLLEVLKSDWKTGVLQYFSSLPSILPTNGITNENPLIKHQKQLDWYTSSILRRF